jgi:hypothetical protein
MGHDAQVFNSMMTMMMMFTGSFASKPSAGTKKFMKLKLGRYMLTVVRRVHIIVSFTALPVEFVSLNDRAMTHRRGVQNLF